MTNQDTRTTRNLRPLLWLVLAISVPGNIVTSFGNADVLFHLGLGLIVLLSATGLIVDHYRKRQ
jgi:hypothetical protein